MCDIKLISCTKRNAVVVYVVIDEIMAFLFKGKIKEKKQNRNLKECLVHINFKNPEKQFPVLSLELL